jgi:hypothetical protein
VSSVSQVFQVSKRESGFAILGPHRLKEFSLIGTASEGKFTVYDTDTAPVAGTYAQSGTTVTVTDADHGLTTGDVVGICFATGTGGTATSGNYPITVTGANTFTITMLNSDTITGTPACNYVANSGANQKNPKRWLMCKGVAAGDSFANAFSVPGNGFSTKLGAYFLMSNLLEADVFYE